MKYDNVFSFYSEETNEGSIYDGKIRTKMPHGFAAKSVWQGECTKSELMEKVKEYEKNQRNY
tara:strand:+ start:2307 stop:2492 length:186 start_codon:yes stop_codon:yes gene_type:complete